MEKLVKKAKAGASEAYYQLFQEVESDIKKTKTFKDLDYYAVNGYDISFRILTYDTDNHPTSA